jgi:DNA-directed RNA polymerase subunit RPC12/RpoP
MRATPCLDCGALLIREDDAPRPDRCTRCGSDALLKPPTPTLVERLRAAREEQLDHLARLAVAGEDADWAYRQAVKDAAACGDWDDLPAEEVAE